MKRKIITVTVAMTIGICMVIGLIHLLRLINVQTSYYINANHNNITIDMDMMDRLYTVHGIKAKDQEVLLHIDHQVDDTIVVLLDYLKFPHEIYINDKLYAQNINKNDKKFLDNYAYQQIKIKDPTTIRVKGKGVKYTTIYVAKKKHLPIFLEKRHINYSFILFAFIMLGMVNMTFFVTNRSHMHFLLFAFVSYMSAFKVIILGEIGFMTRFFGIHTGNYQQWNIITSLLNMIIPAFIMGYLFKMKVSRKVRLAIYIFFVLTCLTVLDLEVYATYFRLILIVMTLFSFYTICYGIWYRKDYCYLVLLNNVIYFALTMYKNNMDIHLTRKGTLDYLVHIGYIGALVYIGGFITIFIYDYFKQVKKLKEKEGEFERISLLRGISHDLKLPLSVIKSSNQIIDNYDLTDEKRKKYLRAGLEATEELEKMTENINSYLKVGVAKHQEHTTSVCNCFNKLKIHFDIYNKDKAYDFVLDCGEEDVTVSIDPIQFYRMIFNLVDNAFKYTPEGGCIHVSYRVARKVIIIVEDSGIGMPLEQQDYIFNPFYRIDDSRSKEGLGLGLSVVRGIVESAKGQIIIDSEPMKGTKVTILLPITHHKKGGRSA